MEKMRKLDKTQTHNLRSLHKHFILLQTKRIIIIIIIIIVRMSLSYPFSTSFAKNSK